MIVEPTAQRRDEPDEPLARPGPLLSVEQIKANGYNLDLKNPHNPDTGPGDVDHLLPEYEKLLAKIAETRAKLKRELQHALTATAGAE